MTTAIIGTGGIGSVIARQLASGGETLRLSSASTESARTLAAEIGQAAVAADNHDALQRRVRRPGDYLRSDRSAYVTGSAIQFDGGASLVL